MQVQIPKGGGGVRSLSLADCKQTRSCWVWKVLLGLSSGQPARHCTVKVGWGRERDLPWDALIIGGMHTWLGDSNTCLHRRFAKPSVLRRLLVGKTPNSCMWVDESTAVLCNQGRCIYMSIWNTSTWKWYVGAQVWFFSCCFHGSTCGQNN